HQSVVVKQEFPDENSLYHFTTNDDYLDLTFLVKAKENFKQRLGADLDSLFDFLPTQIKSSYDSNSIEQRENNALPRPNESLSNFTTQSSIATCSGETFSTPTPETLNENLVD